MPEDVVTKAIGWREVLAMVCAGVVLAGACEALPHLGMSVEDLAWEGAFAAASAEQIACSPLGSYRPLCGALLIAQGAYAPTTKLAMGLAAHVAVAVLCGALAFRLTGRRAAFVWATVVPLCWSTQAEITLWLGGRCDLFCTLLGLLGAHALLFALERRRVAWSLVAAAFVLLASLVKEPGLLLPVVYLPLAAMKLPVISGKPLVRLLVAPWAAALIAGVWHLAVSRGASPYVAARLDRGPLELLGNVAQALAKLALGSTFDWPNTLVAFVAVLVIVGFALACWRGPRLLVIAWVLALSALIAPLALVHAPRTLYVLVAFCAISAAVRFASAPRWRSIAVTAVLVHMGLALAAQRIWVDVAGQRDALAAALVERVSNQRALILGMRLRPMGVVAAAVPLEYLPGVSAEHVLPARYSENAIQLLRPASVVSVEQCRVQLRYKVPPGTLAHPRDVDVVADGDLVTLDVPEPLILIYGDVDGQATYMSVPCDHGDRPTWG